MTPRGIHKGAEPSCGGSRAHEACQRFLLARSVPAAWGEPSRPGLPPGGGNGKGGVQNDAAAGILSVKRLQHPRVTD